MRHTKRKSLSSKKTSSKKKKEKLLSTIEQRASFIDSILNGKVKVTLKDIKYPYKVSTNNSLQIPMVDKKPCDLLNYFTKNQNQRKVLVESDGEAVGNFGLPYLVCQGDCGDQESIKLGVKISFFNVKDLQSYTSSGMVMREITQSLQKKINLDVVKIKSKSLKDLKKKEKYEIYGIVNNKLPQNSEIMMIYKLRELVISKQTPHINLPIMFFQCNLKELLKIKGKKEKKVLSGKHHSDDTDLANVLVSEWCTGGPLHSYIENNLSSFSSSSTYFDVLFFQLFSMLTTIHRTYPSFRHNDLHLGNLLVESVSPSHNYYLYQIRDIVNPHKYTNYVIPNLKFQIRLWDYDISSIDKIVNNQAVISAEWEDCFISQKRNQFFDLVKFFFMFERDVVQEYDLNMDRYQSLIYEDILGGLDYQLYDDEEDSDGNMNFFKRLLENDDFEDSFFNPQKKKDISTSGCLSSSNEKTTPEKLLKKYSMEGGIFNQFIVNDDKLGDYQFIDKFKVK